MVVSRQFGTIGDYLDTGLTASKGAGNDFTFCAWVMLTSDPGVVQICIAGHEASGTGNGFEVYLVPGGVVDCKIRFRPGNGHGATDATVAGSWIGNGKFFAIVNDSVANEIRFYVGTTVANVALHTTVPGSRVLNSPANCSQLIGARHTSTPAIAEPFPGKIQKVALFYDEVLTLAEIKEVAPAEGTQHADIATYYYLMEGVDPEPDSSTNVLDADVTGTTIEAPFADTGVATSLAITGSGTEVAGRSQIITITADNPAYSGDKTLIFSGASVSDTNRPLGAPTAKDKDNVDQPFGSPTVITFVAGVATTQIFLNSVETAVISVTDGTISSSGGDNLTVTVSAPVQLSGGPVMFDAVMEKGYVESGVSPNTFAIYPKAILWHDPAAAGHEVRVEASDGTLLFHATADSVAASQYVKFKKGGIKWIDFIVTQIDSGQLFIWY